VMFSAQSAYSDRAVIHIYRSITIRKDHEEYKD
jgi:hypothetical protein